MDILAVWWQYSVIKAGANTLKRNRMDFVQQHINIVSIGAMNMLQVGESECR